MPLLRPRRRPKVPFGALPPGGGAGAPMAARGGQVAAAHDDVLRRADDGLAVGRAEGVVGGHHQHAGLDLPAPIGQPEEAAPPG